MTSSTPSGVMTAILPCNDLDATERFYRRLGFTRCASQWPPPDEPDTCRLLSNGGGGYLHLTDAVEGWLVPGRNPFGLYLYLEDVDALAAEFQDEILGKHAPEGKASGGQGFRRTRLGACTNSPFAIRNQTLVRVGWPTRLRRSAPAIGKALGQQLLLDFVDRHPDQVLVHFAMKRLFDGRGIVRPDHAERAR
jgi:hypothetical protein